MAFSHFILLQYWTDYQLTWDPKAYGNIKALRIRPEKAWTPDIVLFNKLVAKSMYETWTDPEAAGTGGPDHLENHK